MTNEIRLLKAFIEAQGFEIIEKTMIGHSDRYSETYDQYDYEVIKKRVKRFVKPEINEIKKYILENDMMVDSDSFYNFYESKNWMVGKNKMKSWKATIRGWQTRNEKNKPKISNREHRQNIGSFIENQAKQAVRELSKSIVSENAGDISCQMGSTILK